MFEKQLSAKGVKRTVAIDLKEWFVNQNGLRHKTHIVKILKETEKAVLVNFCFTYCHDLWIPKSVITLTPQTHYTEEEKEKLVNEFYNILKDIKELEDLIKQKQAEQNDLVAKLRGED
jgi:hypothetical protein